MTISPELRRRFRESEPKKEAESSRAETLIQNELIRKIDEHESTSIGEGRSGEVFLLNIWGAQDGTPQPWVVKKQHRLTPEQSALKLEFETEFALHEKALELLKLERSRNPGVEYAQIPTALASFDNGDNGYLIMDHVDGDTLFERAMKVFLQEYASTPERVEEIRSMNKDQLIGELMDDEYIFLLPPRYREEILSGQMEEIDENAFIGIALDANRMTTGESQVLNMKQWEAIENTITALNRAGFHHRDLHASNIMIDREANPHIIDFGLSLKADFKTGEQSGIYTVDVGNVYQQKIVKLPVDSEQLEMYRKIARKRH